MKHIAHCITQAARHPRAAVLGVREYRTDFTTSFEDDDLLSSYDAGRELAHIVTLRRHDPCVY